MGFCEKSGFFMEKTILIMMVVKYARLKKGKGTVPFQETVPNRPVKNVRYRSRKILTAGRNKLVRTSPRSAVSIFFTMRKDTTSLGTGTYMNQSAQGRIMRPRLTINLLPVTL